MRLKPEPDSQPPRDSGADERPPFDAERRAEVQRRSAEIDVGVVVPAPWAEVKNRVRRRLSI